MKNNYDIIQPIQSYSIHRADYAVKYGAEKDVSSAEIKTQVGTIIEAEDKGEEEFKNGNTFFGFRYRYHVLSHHKILSSYQPGTEGAYMSSPDEEAQSELERQQEEDEAYAIEGTTRKSLLYIAYSNEWYETSTNVFVKKKGSYLVIDGAPSGGRRSVIYNGRAIANQPPCDIKLSTKEVEDIVQDNIIIESSPDTVQSKPELIEGEEAERIYQAVKDCADQEVAKEIARNVDLKTVPAEDAAMYFKSLFKKKGYIFYENEDYKLNMIGVRTGTKFTNAFDDVMHFLYKVNGSWVHKVYQITTDPGKYYLQGAGKLSKGTAILVPGQHKYIYGAHHKSNLKKRYEALNPYEYLSTVFRDKNRDDKYDMDPSTIETGEFHINIHRSDKSRKLPRVNKWSAGCQVFNDPKEYKEFLSVCKKAWLKHGKKPLMYTLLMKSDL